MFCKAEKQEGLGGGGGVWCLESASGESSRHVKVKGLDEEWNAKGVAGCM